MYYTVIKHDGHLRTRGKVENTSRRRVFSTFLECSKMVGVFYHSVIHGLGFFICFKVYGLTYGGTYNRNKTNAFLCHQEALNGSLPGPNNLIQFSRAFRREKCMFGPTERLTANRIKHSSLSKQTVAFFKYYFRVIVRLKVVFFCWYLWNSPICTKSR